MLEREFGGRLKLQFVSLNVPHCRSARIEYKTRWKWTALTGMVGGCLPANADSFFVTQEA